MFRALGLKVFGFIFAAVVLTAPVRAYSFIELNTFYFSQSENTGSTKSGSRTFIEGTLGYRIDKAGQYLVGWGVASHSDSETSTQTTTYSSLQMGPRFLWMIDKAKNWSFGFAYYIVTKASYNDGTGAGAETWKGTALHVDGGYNLPVGETTFICIRMNYSMATYTEKIVGSTTYSTISYTKNYIYPSLAAVYIF